MVSLYVTMALYCNFYSKVTQTLIKSAQDPRMPTCASAVAKKVAMATAATNRYCFVFMMIVRLL